MSVRAGVGGCVCPDSRYRGAADAPASVGLSELGLVPLSGVPAAVTAGLRPAGRPGELCREQAGDAPVELQGPPYFLNFSERSQGAAGCSFSVRFCP